MVKSNDSFAHYAGTQLPEVPLEIQSPSLLLFFQFGQPLPLGHHPRPCSDGSLGNGHLGEPGLPVCLQGGPRQAEGIGRGGRAGMGEAPLQGLNQAPESGGVQQGITHGRIRQGAGRIGDDRRNADDK